MAWLNAVMVCALHMKGTAPGEAAEQQLDSFRGTSMDDILAAAGLGGAIATWDKVGCQSGMHAEGGGCQHSGLTGK